MRKKLSYYIFSLLALGTLAMLLVFPAEASAAAKSALALCAVTVVPSLFPFMAVSGTILRLGILERLARPSRLRRLLRLSPAGYSVFALGLLGGYPLGAGMASSLYASGSVQKDEAGRLLRFCDNCGPAFAVSVAGSTVFGSAKAGVFLLAVHILTALILAFIFRGKSSGGEDASVPAGTGYSAAFTQSVRTSAQNCVFVCGFVTFFSVVISLLDSGGALPALCAHLSLSLGAEMHPVRSLVCSFLELGNGVASMAGLPLGRGSAALAAFALGWGGLCVQAQSAAIISESGLSPAGHLIGKLCHGGLSALAAYILFPLLFH